MTASTVGRNTVQYDVKPIPDYVVVPVAAATVIYQGTMVAIDSSGYARMAENTTGAQKIIGRADGPGDVGISGDVDNTSGAAGALTVKVRQGVFGPFANGDSIAITDIGKAAYASDDHTINKGDGAGQYNFAGIIYNKDSLGVYVLMSLSLGFGGGGANNATGLAGSILPLFRARAVATAALAAYAVVAGVLTASANGAMGSVFDGVTIVAGDIVFLPEGIAAAAADAGPYTVTSLGGASAKFVLTRPDWYPDAGLIQQGLTIYIGGEGTLYKGTEWKSFVTTALKVIGTDAPVFWVKEVLQSLVLVAGTKTITNVPARSATLTKVSINRSVANTSTATTGGYHPTSGGANGLTPGVLGTASIIIEATVAAGTINNADVSTVNVLIQNY